MSNLIVNQVVEQMNILPPELQQRVLSYVQSLNKPGKRGISGKKLLKFSGAISIDDLFVMKEAIEADCEQVTTN